MSNIKYSKKFIMKPEGLAPRTYIVYKSFHNDYDTLYVWLDRAKVNLEKEFRDMSIHCIVFSDEETENKFLSIFGENVQ